MTDHPRRATRALLSVSDKAGLIEFARALAGHGIELVSTGGTAKAMAPAGLKVRDVSELTGFPEMMDGRVKTLHPKVQGGLLAIRDNAEHTQAMKDHGIAPIDLLVVNLYPFEATVDKGADFEECIENIDIGGPAMIRAAAKNHDDVAVVVEPQDYQAVLDELAANAGATTLSLRRRLAAKAYARTAAYDAAISNWFANELKTDAPDYRAFGGRLIQALRYGENPHQTAAFYRTPDKRPGVATARQLQGKGLSYNNTNEPDPRAIGLTAKTVAGGLLVQSRDNASVDTMTLKVATKRAPTDAELRDLKFAFRVAKTVKSNTIVYVKH